MNFHGSHTVLYIHRIHFKSSTHTDRTRRQTMSNYVQCNICQKWYTNQRGLLIHLGYCRERHNASEQNVANHHFVEHNPLKSCYDQGEHLNPFAVYDGEFDNSSMNHMTTLEIPILILMNVFRMDLTTQMASAAQPFPSYKYD